MKNYIKSAVALLSLFLFGMTFCMADYLDPVQDITQTVSMEQADILDYDVSFSPGIVLVIAPMESIANIDTTYTMIPANTTATESPPGGDPNFGIYEVSTLIGAVQIQEERCRALSPYTRPG